MVGCVTLVFGMLYVFKNMIAQGLYLMWKVNETLRN